MKRMNDWQDIPAVRDAVDMIDQMVVLLRDRTRGGSSAYLLNYLSTIREGTPWSRKEAFKKIHVMCHPKGFGDLFVEGISSEDWWAHVEKLDEACSAAFAALEEQFPTLSQEEKLKKG